LCVRVNEDEEEGRREKYIKTGACWVAVYGCLGVVLCAHQE